MLYGNVVFISFRKYSEIIVIVNRPALILLQNIGTHLSHSAQPQILKTKKNTMPHSTTTSAPSSPG